MIEAIIFDMDGLLIDSEPCWDEARRLMAEEVGVKWNRDDHKAVMGVSTHEWVRYMIKRLSLSVAEGEVEETIINSMRDLYRRKIPYLDGAIEAVKLASDSYPTGLASGSPQSLIDTITSDSHLQGKFKVILSGDQFTSGKPSPDIYLAAAKALGVQPEKCLCLEDSGNGILAGKNAGMTVIAVPDPRFAPSEEKLGKADIVLKSLKEFSLEMIRDLN